MGYLILHDQLANNARIILILSGYDLKQNTQKTFNPQLYGNEIFKIQQNNKLEALEQMAYRTYIVH